MATFFSPFQIQLGLGAIPLQVGEACDRPARSLTTDSRQIQAGDIFLALRGDRFDGHDFVAQALADGAIAAIVDTDYQPPSDLPTGQLLQVPNTLWAYQEIARLWRQCCPLPLIGITGSVGKTTTKELIAAMLAVRGPVLKTEANYNNEIGVPKTVLQIDPDRHWAAVLEMGMRGRGQIAELARIAQPNIGVITNVGTAHIGLLGSEQAIAEAKCELLVQLAGQDLAILNADNPRLMATAERLQLPRCRTYGLQNGDLQGQLLDLETLVVEGQRFRLPLPGAHNALNFLAGLAIAQELGLDWAAFQDLSVSLPQGRARRLELSPDIVLLDETYNAGLESMLAALQLLAETPARRRIAVLGTMKELGEFSETYHRQVGEKAAALGLDRLLIYADPAEAAAMQTGAAAIATQIFTSADDLITELLETVETGDRLLFKASRSVALDQVLERFITAYTATPKT